MHSKRLLAVLALSCLAGPLFAEAELEGRFWMPEMDGSVKVSEQGQGTDIQLPDTLAIDDEEATEVRLTWRMPGPLVVRFGYMPLSYSGSAAISEVLQFGNVTFPIAFDVASQLDLEYARAGLGLLFRTGDKFRIGPMLELKGLRAEAELDGSVLGIPLISARESQDAGFVSAGLGFDASPIKAVRVVGEVGYSPALDYGELTEAELVVKYSPVKAVSVFGGYRLIDLDLEVDDDTLVLELSGPYVGASLTF